MVFPLPHILVIFSLHHDGHNFFLVFVVFFLLVPPFGANGDDVDDLITTTLYFVLFIFIYPFISHYFYHTFSVDTTNSTTRQAAHVIQSPNPSPIYFSTYLLFSSYLLFMFGFCPDLLMRTR